MLCMYTVPNGVLFKSYVTFSVALKSIYCHFREQLWIIDINDIPLQRKPIAFFISEENKNLFKNLFSLVSW